ncbi:hypothetical protein GGE45_001050 [Rhizobium aethiopicum]|uniref:Uncharacterized protein n=1 Tax=Rhizobium aethiopicum TaxID=1138170 RepID=A0A7W6Q6W2_9HYPH|nr:hypothetical protein [Rhizobium aethiopicum]MBB4191520.1 hypothetical protein [Rhizobium aethiopicum]MBB4578736.1 hypothetical protein [Rhizobium aethiopicum]
MTMNFVARDIVIRHENEWQAIREGADNRIEIGKRKQPVASPISGVASAGKNEPSAVNPE